MAEGERQLEACFVATLGEMDSASGHKTVTPTFELGMYTLGQSTSSYKAVAAGEQKLMIPAYQIHTGNNSLEAINIKYLEGNGYSCHTTDSGNSWSIACNRTLDCGRRVSDVEPLYWI